MNQNQHSKITVGIVLSSVPGYSETFFRNKIKGLQHRGVKVILFVDNPSDDHFGLSCEIVSRTNFNQSFFSRIIIYFLTIFKLCLIHPKRSMTLYKLDKKDGISFKNRIKNLLLNQYLLCRNLEWLHFGYGMLANRRENVAEAVNAKMAVSFRGFDLYLSPIKHEGCYDLLFRKKVKYHVLSYKMKQKLMANDILDENILVITPAIDINLFKPAIEILPKSDTINIVCVSRLHWVKGLHYVLEALSLLKQEEIKFKFTIIGAGEERERLVFAAYQLGIIDEVIFAGKLTQKEIIFHLSHADIYVQYSIQEGFGNAVLEAQALGLLCVVSDADGLQENVLHEKTGLIVPKRNPIALANAIKTARNFDDKKSKKIKGFAIDRVKKEFNLGKQNDLFLEFYYN